MRVMKLWRMRKHRLGSEMAFKSFNLPYEDAKMLNNNFSVLRHNEKIESVTVQER